MGSKRKLDEEGVVSGSVRKSQRLVGSKFQKEQDQGDTVFIHLDSDPVLSTAVDFQMLALKVANTGIRNKVDGMLSLQKNQILTSLNFGKFEQFFFGCNY